MALIRKYMKVVKASVLTEEIGISSKTLRRLEDGEILEVLTGPQKENDDSEVERLKVKATNDDMEGWRSGRGAGVGKERRKVWADANEGESQERWAAWLCHQCWQHWHQVPGSYVRADAVVLSRLCLNKKHPQVPTP